MCCYIKNCKIYCVNVLIEDLGIGHYIYKEITTGIIFFECKDPVSFFMLNKMKLPLKNDYDCVDF